jgi:integrase
MASAFRSHSKKTGKAHPRWRFHWRDHRGVMHTGTGTGSKLETEQIAAGIQAEQDAIRKGWRPAPKESDKPRPLADVAAEYLQWGTLQGGYGGRAWAPEHLRKKQQHLAFWLERFRGPIQDVTLSAVEGALRELARTGLPGRKMHPRPLAGRTLAAYQVDVHALVLWAKSRGYLAADPLENVAPFDSTPQTHRRALTADEIRRRLEAAESPAERLVYEVALCTGYRRGELRSLTVNDLDVAGCTLPLAAEFCKDRKDSRQGIPPALAEKLAGEAAGRAPDAPLLSLGRHPDRSLQRTLKAAGIPKVNPAGKVDFHALRVAFVSLALEAGANVKEAQSLARHATPGLTLNTYGRARPARLVELTEIIGKSVMALPERTAGVQRLAAGAESLCVSRTYDGSNGEQHSPPRCVDSYFTSQISSAAKRLSTRTMRRL